MGVIPIVNENDTVSTDEIEIERQRYPVSGGGGDYQRRFAEDFVVGY